MGLALFVLAVTVVLLTLHAGYLRQRLDAQSKNMFLLAKAMDVLQNNYLDFLEANGVPARDILRKHNLKEVEKDEP